MGPVIRFHLEIANLKSRIQKMFSRLHIIDSHTGGEPTRVIVSGGPELGSGDAARKLEIFRRDYDRFRSATVNEPRGSDVLVGALLVEPADKACVTGVVFFNNVGFLWMCGHGAMGVVKTLSHLGRITAGDHRIETPVGVIGVTLHLDGQVSVTNVPSYRHAKNIKVEVPGIGDVVGDIAWGGNWFFLIERHGLELSIANVDTLTDYAWRIRVALNTQGIRGAHNGEIDHVELFGPPTKPGAHSKNFVLCPGRAYDRSPCGTGTSAKLACLAADGKLGENEPWIQESIIGSTFTGSYRKHGEQILPTLTGSAHINAEATLILNDNDPFCWGIPR